jgi:acetyl esterase
MTKVTLIYDGDCSFCLRSLNRLKRQDRGGAILLVDSHQPDLLDRYPQLRGANFDDAMYAVDSHGRVTEGFDAFRAALRELPHTRWWLWTWWIPGVPVAGRIVYRYIARHRRSFGCDSVCGIES